MDGIKKNYVGSFQTLTLPRTEPARVHFTFLRESHHHNIQYDPSGQRGQCLPRRPYWLASLSRAALHRPTLRDSLDWSNVSTPSIRKPICLNRDDIKTGNPSKHSSQGWDAKDVFGLIIFSPPFPHLELNWVCLSLSLLEQSRHLKVVCGLVQSGTWCDVVIDSLCCYSAVIKRPLVKIQDKKNKLQPLFTGISLSPTVITDLSDFFSPPSWNVSPLHNSLLFRQKGGSCVISSRTATFHHGPFCASVRSIFSILLPPHSPQESRVCLCATGHFSVGLALSPIHTATQPGPLSTRS